LRNGLPRSTRFQSASRTDSSSASILLAAPCRGLFADTTGPDGARQECRTQHVGALPLDSTHQLDYECGRSVAMEASKIYFLIFGVLTIAGGIIGYVKAGSTPSIIAGSITGILLILAALLLPGQRLTGLAIGLIVSFVLAAQFIPKFIRTGKVMPAGMMSVLSAVGIVIGLLAWLKK
jgi:uncharacterized membrane protein (UPF0136 family)